MKCPNNETLTWFIDNPDNKDSKAKRIQDHLANCPTCREKENKIREDIQLVNSSLDYLNPSSVPDRTFIQPPRNYRFKPRYPLSPGIMGTAAAAAAILAVLVFLWILSAPEPNVPGITGNDSLMATNHSPQVRVRSVSIKGKPAEAMIVNLKESNTTIVWVERKTPR